MREIKFRAWKDGRMISWEELRATPMGAFGEKYMTNPPRPVAEFMQFTGLKDKNGVEIYEGDIFCIKKHSETKFVVVYAAKEEYRHEPVYACFAMKRGDDYLQFDEFAMDRGEVIGNIHENPELAASLHKESTQA